MDLHTMFPCHDVLLIRKIQLFLQFWVNVFQFDDLRLVNGTSSPRGHSGVG